MPYELWMGRKLSLKNFYIWGHLDKVKPYQLNETKLGTKIVSNYFIGFTKLSRRY